MEAVGSGLPIIGFDVRYGNQTFIDDGENGYLIPVTDSMEQEARIAALESRILRLFTEADLESFHRHAYKKAAEFMSKEVEQKWARILNQETQSC